MPSNVTAILRRLGDLPAMRPSLGSGVSGSSVALRNAAVSRTVRLSAPSTRRGHVVLAKLPGNRRPRDAFKPNSPQWEAGIRSDPPPSVPCASGKMPAATHAAEPPLDPPGLYARFHGLLVGP